MVLFLIVSIFGYHNVTADNELLIFSKEDIIELALANSISLKQAEMNRVTLSIDYAALISEKTELEGLYVVLPFYAQLFDEYNMAGTIPGYTTYLSLLEEASKGNLESKTEADQMLIDDVDLANAVHSLDYIQLDAYLSYRSLGIIFKKVGIYNPNLTSEEIYNYFINPIYIKTENLQSDLTASGVYVEIVAESIKFEAVELYDLILNLEANQVVLTKIYNQDLATLEQNQLMLRSGQLSQTLYKKALSEVDISKLNIDRNQRSVDSLKMKMNILIGNDVEISFVLEKTELNKLKLEEADYYIALALEERSDLKLLSYDIKAKENELYYVEKYIGKNSIQAKIITSDLNVYLLEEINLKDLIEIEVRNAYIKVCESEENVETKGLAMEYKKAELEIEAMKIQIGISLLDRYEGIKFITEKAIVEYELACRESLLLFRELEKLMVMGNSGINLSGGSRDV